MYLVFFFKININKHYKISRKTFLDNYIEAIQNKITYLTQITALRLAFIS